MLLSDNLVRVWLKIGVETSAPSSVSENMSLRGGGLDGRHRLPMAVWIAFAPTMMRGDEDLHAFRPSGGEALPHMLDNIVRLERRAAEFVELAPLRQKVVVGIDDQQPRQFRLVSRLSFRRLRHTGTSFGIEDLDALVLKFEHQLAGILACEKPLEHGGKGVDVGAHGVLDAVQPSLG